MAVPTTGLFDADNHYYEATDAFTRHLDPKVAARVFQWVEVGKRRYPLIGGKINRAVVNPTFDPVAKPGALAGYFRGNAEGLLAKDYLTEREPVRPEYRDREARIRSMDEQGVQKVWMFPTLGVLYEEPLKHDVEGVVALFRAFNRWVADDWGFDFQDRIFAAPYITLADLDFAMTELDWALEHGARTIVMRPAAPRTALGHRPPSHPSFDPFWQRVNDAGITLVAHGADSGYSSQGYEPDEFDIALYEDARRPLMKMLSSERPITDFLASFVLDRFWDRFPNIRVASIENGATFVADLFKKLDSAARRVPGWFTEDPIETFRQNVWIAPFWEDDVVELRDLIGEDHILFGSDWPHVEGMAEPLDYVNELKVFDDATTRKILFDNVDGLNTLRPV
jgi:predicted TIM-barrel fold metal-dependent hydrolase